MEELFMDKIIINGFDFFLDETNLLKNVTSFST